MEGEVTLKAQEMSLEEGTASTYKAAAKPKEDVKVTYHFRDLNPKLIEAWEKEFASYADNVKASQGDIFQGAPAADAIVSPANSFGFMDGGIDMAYSRHFGWQMQNRLQVVIREEYNGELLVGQAAIIPSMEEGGDTVEDMAKHWKGCNEDKPIKFLISAPTMRVPLNVSDTANAFLAFRAVILAVKKHNSDENNDPIHSVLCPGLGTAVGQMKPHVCARQTLEAYELYELGIKQKFTAPKHLIHVSDHHDLMVTEEARPPLSSNSKYAKHQKTINSRTTTAKGKKSHSPTESRSLFKSYCFIAFWFVMSVGLLIFGFYVEVYLVDRHHKVAEDGSTAEELLLDDELLGNEEL